MTKLALQKRKPHYLDKGRVLPWENCLPFLDNSRAVLIHRPRCVSTMTIFREPVAHASFAANGNIRLWTVRPRDLDGAPAQPLYTWAQMRRLAAAERERCATVCETLTLGPASATEDREVAQACADAIRSGK